MDTDRLSIALQEIVGERLVIVVGSGLSSAEGLAGMGAIADELDRRFAGVQFADLRDEWAVVGPIIKRNGLEAALHEHDPSDELESAIRRSIVELLIPQETAVITNAVGGFRSLRFGKLIPCLYRGNEPIPIITTNYDRLLEVACEVAGLPVDTMFDGSAVGWIDENESRNAHLRMRQSTKTQFTKYFRSHARVIKPHGSLDWYRTPAGPRRFSGSLDLDRLIVSPGRGKYREGYNQPFDLHRQEMNREINRARSLLVVGYGFNDDHLETHLASKIRAGTPTAILTRTLTEKAKEMASQCRNIIAIECSGENECGVWFEAQSEAIKFPPIWDLGAFVDEVLMP